MKKFKYVDMDSPVDMILDMYSRLSVEDAIPVLNEITTMAYNKKLEADNFGEIVYNEETNPKSYTEVVSCVFCKSNDIRKNGKDRNGAQRYTCKLCGRTFSPSSCTLSSHTIQNPGQWMQFIVGLLNCETCETLSEKCGISVPTAFHWRLKVFAALEELAKDVKLSGAICADDTRIPYNFKGNHGVDFLAPRRAHKRGHQNTIKNVQRNMICVICAIDSFGHSFSCYIGFGNPNGKRLSNGFKDKLKVESHTVLVTDGAQSFKKVVDDYKIPRWERKVTIVRNGKRYPNLHGHFHIQKINNYHSKLKRFLNNFNSVSSRYLPGYLLLFDFIENNPNLSKEEMATKILKTMVTICSDITYEELKRKYRIPISNGPEQELWEVKVSPTEQRIYKDWYNKTSIDEICKKYKINRRKIYMIKDKVEKYDLHEKIITAQPKKIKSVSNRNWEIFLKCYHEGRTYKSVGEEYGIGLQRTYRIVRQIRNLPESAAVKKYTKPSKKSSRKLDDYDEIYNDFKLIKSPDLKFQDTYNILASMYNKNPKAISRIIFNKRTQDENAQFVYHCSEERKTMEKSAFYAYLNTRDNQIYNEIVEYKEQNPSVTLTDVFKIIAPKFNLSADRTAKAYYKVKKTYFPPDPNEKKIIWAQHKDKIYNAIITTINENPGFTKTKAVNIVAKELDITPRTVAAYFYDYQKIMQQEQNQVSELIDEAV